MRRRDLIKALEAAGFEKARDEEARDEEAIPYNEFREDMSHA